VIFILCLYLALRYIKDVMHPASPIMEAEARVFQVYFFTLLSLTLLAGWQVARWWHQFDLRRLENQ
jgi:hypothetical protein